MKYFLEIKRRILKSGIQSLILLHRICGISYFGGSIHNKKPKSLLSKTILIIWNITYIIGSAYFIYDLIIIKNNNKFSYITNDQTLITYVQGDQMIFCYEYFRQN